MADSGFSLSVSGEVTRPVSLGTMDLRSLTDAELVADFHCLEGWSRVGLRWRGVRLATLLAVVGAGEAGRYVTVGSGDYTVVLTREQAENDRVRLALEHDGGEFGRSGGLPRLVGPSEWDCLQSVKRVDRIELTREPEHAAAAMIALARLER